MRYQRLWAADPESAPSEWLYLLALRPRLGSDAARSWMRYAADTVPLRPLGTLRGSAEYRMGA